MALSTLRENAGRRQAGEEHKAIGAGVGSIKAALKGLAEFKFDADQAGQALRGLEGLVRELSGHFAGEEAGDGIFAKALAVAPRLERSVLALRQQHAPLQIELQQILEDAGYAGVAPGAWRSVSDRFGAFAKALRDHERAENRIITEAYLRDLGSGD